MKYFFNGFADPLGQVAPDKLKGDEYGRLGWTGGGGVEYAFDSNWSIRAEDRFSEYGHHNLFTGTENIHEGLWDNRIEAGFSYKFDMFTPPAPVVAKY